MGSNKRKNTDYIKAVVLIKIQVSIDNKILTQEKVLVGNNYSGG